MLKTKDFEEVKQFKDYTPSKAEATKVWFVDNRFEEMREARTVVDKYRDTYQRMINADFEQYPDERSSSTVPLASSIIELFVWEADKIRTEYNFKGETSEYSANAKALEYVWKYDWRKNNRRKAFLYNEYITAAFGTSVMYTGFESYETIQQDFAIDDNMVMWWKERVIKHENIVVKNIDIRNFYIDNQAIESIDDASDCIWEQMMGYEKFKLLESNPLYKNIDKISPVQYDNGYKTFIIEEESVKQWNFVKLRHYWNVDKDLYVVVANGILIREHPMISTIDWEKALPFIVRVLGKKNYSIYGRGICEALMMFNSEINNLRELLMDAIRRSNTQVLALWNWLSFDGRTFSYDNEILTFDGNLANNFQQISGNPPNQAIFWYMDRLYKDIAVYVGIDINNIVGTPSQTAFQTEVQREASQKRVNIWLTNRDLANERFANLYKDLLQIFFPRKDAEWLYPKIEIEDEELKGWVGDKPARFRKKKWKSMFEVTPAILQWQIYIDVFTNATAPTINAVDREQKLSLLTTIWQISEWYAIAKQAWFDLNTVLPIKDALRDIASDYNLEPQNSNDNSDVKEEKMRLMWDMQKMMGWAGGTPPAWQSPAWPSSEMWQPQAPEWTPLPANQPPVWAI